MKMKTMANGQKIYDSFLVEKEEKLSLSHFYWRVIKINRALLTQGPGL